jgi:thioredoxin 1
LPEYEEVAKAMHKKAGFYKLDFDLCKATNERHQVAAIPTIIIFKEGKEVKRYVGLTSKERIIADLKVIANY